MSITFSSGGFDGTMRSDSSGNIFIETTGNTKTINIGGLVEYTGSITRQLDLSTGKTIKETQTDILTGKTFERSGSSTTNQIEMLQNSNGAFVTVSGSNPGFNIVKTLPFESRLFRRHLDTFATGSTALTVGMRAFGGPGNFQYNINPAVLSLSRNANTLFTISSSGNAFVKNNLDATSITATSLNVTHFTSSFLTSSTIVTEGSNTFGDTIADTHLFNGHITASGNISASGTIFGNSGSFNYITASIIDVDADTIRFGGEPFTKANILTLKEGKSLRTVGEGKSHGDITAHDGTFDGDIFKTKLVQMTNSSSVIDTFNTGSFRSAKYVLQVTSASNYQVSEMLVLHNDGTTLNTEYAQLNSGLNLINFTTGVIGNSVLVNAGGSFISCSVRYDRTIIPI